MTTVDLISSVIEELDSEEPDYSWVAKVMTKEQNLRTMLAEIEKLLSDQANTIQNMKEAAHALSDVRRFVETKFRSCADLPGEEAVVALNGPECKHEADAIIAALGRVAAFYEGE